MAVRLDIRPRLRLSPQPPAAPPRRARLPAFALPAAAYWIAMAGLTYGLAHLGPRPLEQAFAAAPRAPALPPLPLDDAAQTEPPPAPGAEPAPWPMAAASVEAPPPLDSPAVDEPAERRLSDIEPAEPKLARAESRAARRRAEPTTERETRPRIDVDDEAPVRQLPAEPSLGPLPEFTDTPRAAPRERAASGPRLAGLFERAEPGGTAAEQEPSPPSDSAPPARRVLASCEAAVARNNEQLEIGGPRGPADITREAYASILQNGRYLSACRVPPRTVVEICAAVKQGRAVGVTVVTNPPSAALEACVRGRVAGLSFPSSERLDVTHTRFDAAR